jgi:hypothetical protein
MKCTATVLILFVCFTAQAQDTTGYIAFSLIDSMNQVLDDSELALTVFANTPDGSMQKIQAVKSGFDTTAGLFFIHLPDAFLTSDIHMHLKKISGGGDSLDIRLNLGSRFNSPDHFKNLLILRIPVARNRLIIDMPKEESSWNFVPRVRIGIDGVQVWMREITFMQNWWNQ